MDRWAVAASLALHVAVIATGLPARPPLTPAAPEPGVELVLVAAEPPAPPAAEPPPAPSPPPDPAPATPPAAEVAAAEPPPAAPAPIEAPKPPVRAAPKPAARPAAPLRPSDGAPGPASAAAPAAPPALAAPATATPDWRAALLAWVQAHKEYPPRARLRGIEGVVTVRVTVTRDGHVTAATIEATSGAISLDEAVLRLFDNATLPAFPPAMPQPVYSETLRVGFALQ